MRTVLLLGALTGCATAGNFQTAHTTGPGGWEVGADVSAAVIVDVSGDLPYLPLPRVAGRVGVSERTELGGSLGLEGAKLGPRVQLTDPDDEGVIVTVGLAGKFLPLPSPDDGFGWLAGAEESVYVGFPVQQSQLVLLARGAQDVGRVAESATLVWTGGGVGWSWSPDERFRLMPEVGVMVPVYVSGSGGDNTGFGGGVVQLGVGFAYGQRR